MQYLEYCDTLKVADDGDGDDFGDDSDGKRRRRFNSGDSIDSGSSASIATAITAMTAPTVVTTNKVDPTKVWRCDKCHVRTFPSMKDAMDHEMNCSFGD